MNREEAHKLLKENLFNNNLLKHCLAVEAIMRGLAKRLGGDSEKWGIAGLLHDIDYEKTKDAPLKHSLIGAEMLKNLGFGEEICEAVKTHNEAHSIAPEGLMAKALFVCDPISGLIVASTLVLPSKNIKELTTENVLNRFKEKAFARGANREIIGKCELLLGLSLEEFVKISLDAMKEISKEIEL
ncbi:HDIG domain-containing protein [Patescibacteria group bacterium]|nr:HDIG domain-containing protein [Patescibacteria group bacterium]MBU4162139.1 HDIG domain-containing protein [Patescibacteria group bacterium]